MRAAIRDRNINGFQIAFLSVRSTSPKNTVLPQHSHGVRPFHNVKTNSTFVLNFLICTSSIDVSLLPIPRPIPYSFRSFFETFSSRKFHEFGVHVKRQYKNNNIDRVGFFRNIIVFANKLIVFYAACR